MELTIKGTSLEPLMFWKRDHSVADAVDFASSTAATLARLGSGAYVGHLGKRPSKVLELYDREGCPLSRKVREALSILDLDAIIHPCPEGGTRFRAKVEEHLGRFEIPFLVDPNAGVELTDSDEIVRHLFATYGDDKVPLALRVTTVTNLTSKLASRLRGEKGTRVEASKRPDELLELYGYEASPYCRIVREVLSTLELPYVLHNVARESPKRASFIELAGKMQVPLLLDRTHSVKMFETRDIVRHLEERYGVHGGPTAKPDQASAS